MPNESMKNKLPANVRMLGWLSFCNDVASEMVYPLLPTFLLTMLGGSRFYLGLIEGASESLASLLKLWSGARSDRSLSRKPFIVFGYALAAACRPLTAILTAPWQLLIIRLSDRVGKGVRSAPRDALIVDSTEPNMRGRAFGFQRSMDHLGAAIGPLLATAFLLAFPGQLRWLFALTVLPGLVVIAILVFGLRESPRSPAAATAGDEKDRQAQVPFPGGSRISELGRGFGPYMIAIVLFTLGNSTDAFLLVRAQEIGVPVAWLPMLWSVFHLLKSSLSVLAGQAIDRFGAKRLLVAGWMVYMAAYLGFALASVVWQVLGLFALYAIFYAIAEPAERAMVATLCAPEQRGLAYGWFNAAIGIAALPASLWFGWLYENYGPIAAFGFGSALALAASITLHWVPTTRPGEPAVDKMQPQALG